MKYVNYEKSTGEILGYYDRDIHCNKVVQKSTKKRSANTVSYDTSKIPKPFAEISDDVWKTAIEINANHYDEATGVLSVKELRTPAQIQEDMLENLKLAVSNHINKVAHKKRTLKNGREYQFGDTVGNAIHSTTKYVSFENDLKEISVNLLEWNAQCWEKAMEIKNDILSGNMSVPSDDEAIALLPVFDEKGVVTTTTITWREYIDKSDFIAGSETEVTSPDKGTRYKYKYKSDTIYRFVKEAYTKQSDCFYSDEALTKELARRV